MEIFINLMGLYFLIPICAFLLFIAIKLIFILIDSINDQINRLIRRLNEK